MKEYLQFQEHQVEIRRRRYLTRLGVSVYPNGKISVSANKTLSQKVILKFLLSKQSWIERTVGDIEKFRKKYPPKTFSTGEKYPFLGKEYELSLVEGKRFKIQFVDQKLELSLPRNPDLLSSSDREKFFQIMKKSYKEVAKKIITARVEVYSQKMKLYPTGLGFRSQKTIWGSCSAANKISLNCKLIVAPMEVIDYVVVHELAHIRHKNHSKRFWGHVDKYVSSREFSKQWLSENHYLADFLSPQSELWL